MLVEDVLRGFFRAYQRARDEGHTSLALDMADALAEELLRAPAAPAPPASGPTPPPEEPPPSPPTGTDPPPSCPRRDAYSPDEKGGNAWRQAVRRWEQKTGLTRPAHFNLPATAPATAVTGTRDTPATAVAGSVGGLSRVSVTGRRGSRASESVSGLRISEENQLHTVGVGSGTPDARATPYVAGTPYTTRDSVAGEPVTGVAGSSPGTEPPRSPELGAAAAALLEVSSETPEQRVRRVLDASSGGRIRGLLTAESEAVFRRFVASALSQGFELEDFEAFAQLVAAGRATWWRSSWSLALLVKNDAHGLVMGLERGRAWRLEQRARKKAPPPATRGGEPQSLGDVEQLRAFIAGAGLSKAGGT